MALDAKTGKEMWKVVNGDPKKGETNTATVLPVKDKVIVGISGAEFGVRGHVTAYDAKTGKQALARLLDGAGQRVPRRPGEDHVARQAGRQGLLAQDLDRRPVEDRRRLRPGAGISYDPDTNLFYYGTANPSTWNPAQRAGPDGKPIDQKWTMSHLRP